MWTKADEKFLRSMRIDSSNPPAALPRFRVEQAEIEGWYRVVDAVRSFETKSEFGPPFNDPRGAAEDLARQLNEKHMRMD